MYIRHRIIGKLHEKRAQILLPAVFLAPIFVLVIYLLFETAKVSMAKVRQQFALDNAAYTQISSISTYLNAVAYVSGPFPYRVLQSSMSDIQLDPRVRGGEKITVFDLFYKGGGFPSIGLEYETGQNPPPPAASVDWGFKYYDGDTVDENFPRSEWEKETPAAPQDDKAVPVMSKKLADEYYFEASSEGGAVGSIVSYVDTYARLGSIYKSQDYIYKEVSKNDVTFREAYYLNVNDCDRSECARQSAAQIRPFLDIRTKPFELNKIEFYASESNRRMGYHASAYPITFNSAELLNGEKLFQFAYLEPSTRNRLKTLARGLLLKQPFKLPRNHFNINLEQKYKPYVRNRIVLSCPRNSNNCVWPNPLPKYTVTLEP